LYWELEETEAMPTKRKKIKVDEESVTDLLLMVKTAISLVKTK